MYFFLARSGTCTQGGGASLTPWCHFNFNFFGPRFTLTFKLIWFHRLNSPPQKGTRRLSLVLFVFPSSSPLPPIVIIDITGDEWVQVDKMTPFLLVFFALRLWTANGFVRAKRGEKKKKKRRKAPSFRSSWWLLKAFLARLCESCGGWSDSLSAQKKKKKCEWKLRGRKKKKLCCPSAFVCWRKRRLWCAFDASRPNHKSHNFKKLTGHKIRYNYTSGLKEKKM